ncbi:class F sortase [Sporosarcina sp. Sa2YVA2]|uniref:Class F sortase n=1 Tax=Sporosarcina quadrami TaxID=2762234 RepID=A0ABR8UA08_9BACL|nr:class F sortase [Sporosarcina quadrami]MBD7984852.1 class F sortase [Sporosarcina quadrami]
MKNLFVKTILFVLSIVLLTACASNTENPKASIADEPKKPVDVSQPETEVEQVVEDAIVTSIPAPSAEGLTLTDNRVGIQPTRIEIPALHVDAVIEEVGRLENGQMGVPQNPDHVGWFSPGVKPGSQGSAVMAGHVDSLTGPAVFYKLVTLEIGDEIIVHGDDEALTFIVTKKEEYPRQNAPVDKIFGFTYTSTLNLITCTGVFDRKAKTHDNRLVIYTELKKP